jgi:hypothetical protein
MSDLYATDAARELAELGASARQVMADLARWRQADARRSVSVTASSSVVTGEARYCVQLADANAVSSAGPHASLLTAACAALWHWNHYYPGKAFESGLVHLIPRLAVEVTE